MIFLSVAVDIFIHFNNLIFNNISIVAPANSNSIDSVTCRPQYFVEFIDEESLANCNKQLTFSAVLVRRVERPMRCFASTGRVPSSRKAIHKSQKSFWNSWLLHFFTALCVRGGCDAGKRFPCGCCCFACFPFVSLFGRSFHPHTVDFP